MPERGGGADEVEEEVQVGRVDRMFCRSEEGEDVKVWRGQDQRVEQVLFREKESGVNEGVQGARQGGDVLWFSTRFGGLVRRFLGGSVGFEAVEDYASRNRSQTVKCRSRK